MSQSTPTQHEIDVYAGEYVLNGDQSKAWRKAFPSSKCNDDSVYTKASKFHKVIEVLSRIDELRVKTAENDAEEFDITASEIKRKLIAIYDMGTEEKASGGYENLSAAGSSLAEVNRMNGNHAATKQELTGKDGGAIETADMSERELARRIAFALAKGARK